MIWLLSNALRGWSGVFLLVIFFDWCRAAHKRRLVIGRIMIIGVLIIVFYLLLSNFKWIMRASSATGFSLDTLIDGFANNLEANDYLVLIGNGLTHLLGRIQTTSILVDVFRLSDLLQEKFSTGEFAPFWKEDLHDYLFDRLFSSGNQQLIGVAFTKYESFGFDCTVGDWNISLG